MNLPKNSQNSNANKIPSVADKIKSLIDAQHRPIDTNPWADSPAGFEKFFASHEHMDFPPLSEKQIEFCQKLLPDDPKNTFDPAFREKQIGVLLSGKGSGKDALSVMLACYFVQVLLCLKNPFEFIYGANVTGEPIDIIIVAPRGRTSEKVTFEKLKQRVLNWKWLKSKYRLVLSGRDISAADRNESDDVVEIGSNSIVFPNNIRIFSLNSSIESAEGFSIIVFIATEFAAFVNSDDKPNAEKIYNVLYTSANTRFPKKFLGLLISYPRYKGDAMMVKYDEAQKSPHMFGMKCASWVFNPMLKRENYEAELNSDDPNVQAEARAKYLCEPGERFDRPVQHMERVLQCVSGRSPVANLTPTEYLLNGMRMRTLQVEKYNIHRQPDAHKYVARIDLGKTRDRAVLCVAHLSNKKVIVDLMAHWVPDPKTGLVVDVDDPATLLLKLKKELINVSYCTYDRWNSASSINRLNKKGIISDQLSLGPREYSLMFSVLYAGGVDLLNVPALIHPEFGELNHLVIDRDSGKVDHEDGFHNDLTEGLCGVVAMLLGTKKNVDDIPAGLGNVRPNMHEVSNNVWSDGDADPFGGSSEEDDDIFPGEGISVPLL